MPREYEFDGNSQRYRITSGPGKGQFVSAQAIASLTESYIEQSKESIQKITQSLLDGSLRVGEWERQVAQQLKYGHINSYLLGRGGLARMQGDKDRNYAIAGNILKGQYQYLRGFSQDILAGKLTEAQILSRMDLYIDAFHSTYERARQESHIADGYKRERRIRNAKESCSDCIEYAARGWQAIGSLPNPGQNCACISNCRCHKEYSKEEGQIRQWGWVGPNPALISFKTFTYS